MLLLANISFLFVNIEPVSASLVLTLKWTRNLGQYAKTYIGPLAADVNNDGKLEIIVTGGTSDPGTDGTVTVLDGDTGNIIWQVSPGGVGKHTPFEIADINNDDALEIIVFGNYPLVLHGSNGSIYWKNTAVSSYNLFSAVYDIDGDGFSEIFVSSGLGPYQGYAYITSMSYDGKILNQAWCWHPCWGGLTIGDANFDGQFELYQGDRSYYYNPTTDPYKYGGMGLRALDAHTLSPLWNDSDILCSSHTPMLADVDNDGILDVIAAWQGSGLVVLNSADGSVLTTGGKYRKERYLNLPSHSQPTVCDIDGDGNLEIITCRSTNPKIWDLYDWKLDAVLPVVCYEPPKVGDVTDDGKLDIIAATGSEIYIYSYDEISKTYVEVDHITASCNAFTLLQDVDSDGYNELITTSAGGTVRCFDTPALAPNSRVRSETQFYSERHLGAAECVPPSGPLAPQISESPPSDGATNVPVSVSQLSFKLTDFQKDKINYTVTTNPDVGSGNGINVPNGKYTIPITNLAYSTTYTWTVTATDGTNTNTKTFTFATSDLQPWYNTDWQYRRTITIDHTKVSGNQTNFPLLIDIIDSSLVGKAQPDGDDFVFTDSNNVKLNHEIELYDNSTGRLLVWVNVPSLSSTTYTVLYMYYGNPNCENQQNAAAVWDSSYKMVLHLYEKTGIHYDSTINDNNGAAYGGVAQGVAGKIDGADTFDGANDYIEIPHSDTLAGFTEALTVSFWIKLEDTNRRQAIINKYNTATNQRGWFIEYNPVDRPTRPFGFYASQDGTNYREWYANFVPTADVWYYVTVVWETNAIPKFYINGVQVPTVGTATIPSIYNNVDVPLHIGRSTYNTARYLKGSLDEITISNPARSSDWILTSYNNQKDPATFYTVGAEEVFEPCTLTIIIDGQGSAAINPDKTSYKYGDNVTLTAMPDVGYEFAGWSGDLTGNENPVTITITKNMTITAHFTQNQYTITTNIIGQGYVTKYPEKETYTYGEIVTLTAIANAGWNFSEWSGDLTGTQNPINITMNGNKNITATFILVNTPPQIDSYNPTTDPTILEGDSQEFNITCSDPDNDELLIQWYLNNTPVGTTNSTTYTFPPSSAGTYSVAVMVSDGQAEVWHNWTIMVTSGNTPPSIEGVTISPKPACSNSTLTASPYGWSDPDGDSEDYIYQWQKWDGTNWQNITGATGSTLNPSNFANGDIIRVMCTPYDGKDYGETKHDTVTIEN